MDQVTAIRLQTPTSVYFDFPWFAAPEDAKYVVKSADGLGPTEVTAGSRVPNDREVVLLVGLYPDYAVETVAELRQAIYRILSPWINTDLTLQLMNGLGVVGSVVGHVTKFEIAPWSKDPAIQITIRCKENEPYFYGPALYTMTPTFGGAEPTKFTVTNLGTAPTGMNLAIVLSSALSSYTIARDSGLNSPKMTLTYAFAIGDIIQIETTFGSRYARVVRGGVTTNLLHVLNTDVTWHQLHAGDNNFYVSSTAVSDFDVVHRPMYQGV